MLGNCINEFPISSSKEDPFQRLRSTSDVTQGNWLPRIGSDLYPMLNALSVEDNIYILNSSSSSEAEVVLPISVENPGTHDNHYFQYEGQGNYTIYLMQGTTIIAYWVENDQDSTFHVRKLSLVEASSITDYSDLSIKIINNI